MTHKWLGGFAGTQHSKRQCIPSNVTASCSAQGWHVDGGHHPLKGLIFCLAASLYKRCTLHELCFYCSASPEHILAVPLQCPCWLPQGLAAAWPSARDTAQASPYSEPHHPSTQPTPLTFPMSRTAIWHACWQPAGRVATPVPAKGIPPYGGRGPARVLSNSLLHPHAVLPP